MIVHCQSQRRRHPRRGGRAPGTRGRDDRRALAIASVLGVIEWAPLPARPGRGLRDTPHSPAHRRFATELAQLRRRVWPRSAACQSAKQRRTLAATALITAGVSTRRQFNRPHRAPPPMVATQRMGQPRHHRIGPPIGLTAPDTPPPASIHHRPATQEANADHMCRSGAPNKVPIREGRLHTKGQEPVINAPGHSQPCTTPHK